MTENDVKNGVSVTKDMTELDVALAELSLVGLLEKDIGTPVDKKKVAAGLGHVNVLLVVPRSYGGDIEPCGDDFFSQFPTVEETGGWLKFSALLPLTKRQALYIRSSYTFIATQALLNRNPDQPKYAVVTGTPGAGKSVFVYYVMWRLIKDENRVLLFDKDGYIYFDGSMMFDCASLPNKFDKQYWTPDSWCLVDSVDPTNIAELPSGRCSVLFASTPRRDCMGESKKLSPTPEVFYLPLWTSEELAAIAPLYPDATDVWIKRLEYLGGVPRLVLQGVQTDPETLLWTACSSCSLNDCIMLLSIFQKAKLVQNLIHIRSEEPYGEPSAVYASPFAMQMIAQTKWRTDRTTMENLLSSSDGHPRH